MISLGRKDAIAALFLAALTLVSWLPRLKGPIDLRWDASAYYVLGTALAEGKGYRLLNEPGEIQTTLHPPLLPVIVALHQLVLRTSDVITVGWWLRLFYLVLFVAYAVAVYFLLRAFLPPGYAVLAAVVGLFQLQTVFMSDLCYPEIPFALATVLFTLCNVNGGKQTGRLLSLLLAVISFTLRTVGVALLAAWAVESVCQRRFKQAAGRLLFTLTLILCWAGYIVYVESGREYQNPAYEYQRADYAYINVSYARNTKYKDPFSPELGYTSPKDRIQRFIANLWLMPASLSEAISTRRGILQMLRAEVSRRVGHPIFPPWVVRLYLYLLAAFIIGGILLQLFKRQYFIPLYILFSLVIVCATPWPVQFIRYLAPLAPFLSLSLFFAVRAAAEQLSKLLPVRPKVMRFGLTSVMVLLIFASQAATLFLVYTKWHQKAAFNLSGGERIEYRLFFYDYLYRATDAGLDWLKGQAKGDEVVAATDPQWVYLRTKLKTVLPPLEVETSKAQRLLDSVPVKYLIVDEGLYNKYTTPVVAAYPDRWRRVYVDSMREEVGEPDEGKFAIYERVNAQ